MRSLAHLTLSWVCRGRARTADAFEQITEQDWRSGIDNTYAKFFTLKCFCPQ